MLKVSEPLIDNDDIRIVSKCLKENWISGEGKYVKLFEKKFSKFCNRKYGVAINNGTSALEIAVRLLNLKKDDEVICPSFSIISVSQAIYKSGAKIIPVDCKLDTFNIDPSLIIKSITKKTKAILVVHTYGLPCEMNEILSIAKKRKITIIEDSAEMHGQTYNKKICGSFGLISTFSFYSNKHLTTGEGGMILTNNYNLYKKAKYYRNLCFSEKKRFVHYDISSNYRITNIQCALGISQLKKINFLLKTKIKNGKLYNKLFKQTQHISLPIEKTDYASNNYWVYPIVLSKNIKLDASDMIAYLKEKNIQSRPFFWPVHKQPFYLKKGFFKNLNLENSEYLAKKGLYLPCGMTTKDNEIKKVVKIVKKFIENNV